MSSALSPSETAAIRRSEVLLVGGALTPRTVAAHKIVNAAAANWQMHFAQAISNEWHSHVTCFSYVPTTTDETPELESQRGRDITIVPIFRELTASGFLDYSQRMLAALREAPESLRCVFCYNPLVVTAPWALAVALYRRVPMVMIVADLEPGDRPPGGKKGVRWLAERALLRTASRFLILSPAVRRVLRSADRYVVFNGLADQTALSAREPVYGERVRFVYAGSPENGLQCFLDAAAIVAAEGKNCDFHIFGKGSRGMELSPFLREHVTIHGFVDTQVLSDFLGRDAVGVNPRRIVGGINEFNTPYKLLHYLSRGVLTVSTMTEGMPADLAQTCVMAGDGPQELAKAFRRVLDMTPAARAALAGEGRRLVAETRSPAALAAALRDLVDAPAGRERHATLA